jgi:chromosome segregation ATPase
VDDDAGTGRWMTYDELAEVRGIKRIGAVRLVQRYKWRRQAGNDGRARVLVPHDALEKVRGTDASTDAGHDDAGTGAGSAAGTDNVLLAGALSALEDAVLALREQLDASNARAERAEADRADERLRADRAETAVAAERQRADDLRAQIDVLNAEMAVMRAAADRALTEERLRADRLSEQVDAGHRDRDAARAEADALRGQVAAADTDRRVAQARLEHAEAAREGERARADALRDRLTTMQEQLAGAHAALQAAESADARAVRAEQDKERAEASRDTERQRADQAERGREADRARADVLQAKLDDVQVQLTARQEVIDAAEAIRKADDARLARSRLRRAWDGWRGR